MSNRKWEPWESDWMIDSAPRTFQGKSITGVTVERKQIRTKPNGRGFYTGGYRLRSEWKARRGNLVSGARATKREAITELLEMEATQ